MASRKSADRRELVVAILVGALAGGISGGVTSYFLPSRTVVQETPTATSTPQGPVFVKIEPESDPFLVPPKPLLERASAIGVITLKKRGATAVLRSVDPEDEIGRAVSLTSDGWLVTAAEVVENREPGALTVWIDDTPYTPEQFVFDSLNGTAFVKVDAQDLTSPVFGNTESLSQGAEAWLEAEGHAFRPAIVYRTRVHGLPTSQSSERSYRYLTVVSRADEAELGSALWDPRGALLGLVRGDGEMAQVIPSGTISTSFASLLSNGEIRHAELGATVRDLSDWRIDGDREDLPQRGAIVLSVDRNSPASDADIRVDDVILQVERDILDGTADLGELLAEFQPGSDVTFRILRGGEELTILVTLGTQVTSDVIE